MGFSPAGISDQLHCQAQQTTHVVLVNPQYNLKNEFGAQKWMIVGGFAVIVR
jgi:hypothetical protein